MANIRELVESALKARLDAAGISAVAYVGFSDGTKASPCVVCSVPEAEEIDQKMGVFTVTCKIETRSALSYGAENHSALEAEVVAAIHSDDMPGALTGTGLTVYSDWGSPMKQSWDIQEDCWVHTLEFLIAAAPSTLT